MIVYAAGLSGLGLVALLLNLASVGTFLHTGLKLPYFTWLGKSDPENPVPKPQNIPKGMYISMGLTAAICIAIGVNPSMLYNILPYPVEYQPYTSGHILETVQILVFTGIGFWLLIKVLKPKPTISLDTDWFYRRPAKLAYRVFIVPVSQFFGGVENLVRGGVQLMTKVVANPTEYIPGYHLFMPKNEPGGSKGKPVEYDPDYHRLPVEPMLLVVIFFFIIIIAWSLWRL
jgi:multicomponent Na+:H+ antiporter subunit D